MRTLFRRPGLWLLIALLVACTIVMAVRARGPTVKVAVAARKDLEQRIVASGRVRVPTRVQVAAQVPGLVVAVGAIEGQRVKAGDLLVQIDDAEARAAVSQAKAAVDQANARVEQLRRVGAIVATEALRQAETNLERAEVDLARVRELSASGAVAQAELDNARHSVELARAQKVAAEAQRIASAPMGADSRVALTALLQAQAQYVGADVRLAQTRIVAHQDGVVLTRSVEPGDVVQPARTLVVLAADGSPQLVFQPDERNLAWIALGQKARASADAYPQQVFDAEVSYIAPSIDPQRGSVEVRLSVPSAPAFLLPDMTVSIDLSVARREKALIVPSDAVRDAATPAPWLFAVEDDRLVRKDVKLGIRGEGAIEVVEGLDEGSVVVLPDGRGLAPGQRVRAERD
ncbi:efflux RND transporter periplasmic adaptor subunit [Sorangium sp. So ce406]|uniref:efflux RND transporter periplasmic adaptor subunit n=1 Tax=Sorangium sp. So ce406 TaxID=3133311 RepID=UPI003F5BA814